MPQSVLLGVSYLQSRWDAHDGAPSVTGGYGPMHLTDARTALARRRRTTARARRTRAATAPAPPLHPKAKVPRDLRAPGPPQDAAEGGRTDRPSRSELRTDPAANVAGGAALLAAAQKELGEPLSADPADWYGAVARFSGADDTATAAAYANDVYDVLRTGEDAHTDAGQQVALAAQPRLAPDTGQLRRAGLRTTEAAGTECPPTCPASGSRRRTRSSATATTATTTWRPPALPDIEYIVVHDTEGAWDGVLNMVQDPTYVSWHYTLRSTDGHIAQHVKAKDVAWHAGNWYVNAKSIGLEHEGFLAAAGRLVHGGDVPVLGTAGEVPGEEVRHPAGPAAHPRP